MKKRSLILASILVGSLGVAGAGVAHACSDHKGEHGDGHRGDKMMHVMKELDLSKEQREAIRDIKNESRDQMQAQRDKMHEIRKALREQASAETLDISKVRKLADEKSKIMADMTVQRMQSMHQIRKQLTPEQLEKFDKMKEKRFEQDDS